MNQRNYYQSHSRSPYHLSAGALVMNDDGRILAHHHPSITHAGMTVRDLYLLMRETVEMGETLEQAVARGLMEECGVTARIETYLGSLSCTVHDGGYPWQKTTLYFLCRVQEFDPARRDSGDPESGSVLEWHDADFLIKHMQTQGGRTSREDVDESEIVRRAQALL